MGTVKFSMDDGPEIESESRPKNEKFVTWWHYSLAICFIILLTLIAPRGKSPEFAHLSIGSISPAKIIAPFDFEILKNSEELETERDYAASEVLPLFIKNDTTKAIALKKFAEFGSEVASLIESLPDGWLKIESDSTDSWNEKGGEAFLKGSRNISDKYGLHLNWEQWSFLFKLYLSAPNHNKYNILFSKTGPDVMTHLYRSGVCASQNDDLPHGVKLVAVLNGNVETVILLDSLNKPNRNALLIHEYIFDSMNRYGIDSVSVKIETAILSQFLIPNLVYNPEETERRRESAVNSVPLAKGFVIQDELIIDSHIKVTEDHLDKLNSLAVKRAELSVDRGGVASLLPIIGQLVIIALLTAFMMFGVSVSKPEVWSNWQKMLLLLLVLASVLLFFRVVPIGFGLSRQLFPAAFTALLLTILLGRTIAALGLVTLALAGGFLQGNDFQTTTYALANGGVAIMALRSLQARKDLIKTGIYLAGVSLVMVAGFYLVTYEGDGSFWAETGLALGMAFVSPMLVLGIVPLIESLFGITTDLTLLELVDLNRPLLRQLALKSPGTYHHSLMVGSLAESAARVIGANSLLTRAGAYYHDIGKIDIREYFIENQETGSENIHDRLAPSESARIVIEHVNRGMELASQHKLPPEIKMFITEHHGKTKLAYFYSKAQREQGKKVDESRFRYAGPKPQTRETAILMLADGIEAATRSLDHPSQQDLREMVDKFVSLRLAEGDLDECPLTLKEITHIKEAFLKVLLGMHHQRIQYPDSSQGVENTPETKNAKIGRL